MPDFQYTARQMSGEQVTGVLQAANEQDALANLATRQLFPMNIKSVESKVAASKGRGRRVKGRELAVFYSQLADLLKSGVPLLRSIELLEHQATNSRLSSVLQDVRERVSDGNRLYESMRRHPAVFSELVTSMVRAGEEGGFLEDVLKRIAAFTDHAEDLKGRVVGAMIYPIFLLSFGTLVVVVLLVYFVPKFEPIFQRMEERGALPWATTALLGMSRFAQTYWLMGVVALLGLGYMALRWLKTEPGRLALDRLRLKIWGLGRVVRSLAIARFCRILGTMLRNGVPILQSLRISKDAMGNRVLSMAIEDASDNISAGKSLAKPLGVSKQFPPDIVEMIAVGEEANNLENVLVDISENLERRTARELDVVVRMLEPLLLLVMAAIVLFVVIALLLPILQSSTFL